MNHKALFVCLIFVVILTGCMQSDITEITPIELSPTFEIAYIDHEGKNSKRMFQGIEGKLGITPPLTNESTVSSNKVMWYFWAEEDDIIGKNLVVQGIRMDTGEEETLFDSKRLVSVQSDENFGEVVSLPSIINFASTGIWKLNIYLDDIFYETIVVEGKEKEFLSE